LFGVASRYVEAKSEAHASPQSGYASRKPAFNCGVTGRYAERMAPTLCRQRTDVACNVSTIARTIAPAIVAGKRTEKFENQYSVLFFLLIKF
jgi:hypothetical protein